MKIVNGQRQVNLHGLSHLSVFIWSYLPEKNGPRTNVMVRISESYTWYFVCWGGVCLSKQTAPQRTKYEVSLSLIHKEVEWDTVLVEAQEADLEVLV